LWVLGYTPGNAFANPFDNAVAQFMADNPDIKVEITGYPPNDEGFTKLTTALQSGQGIDLLRLPSDRLPQFVRDDLIEPIDDYLTAAVKADILPNVLDVTRLQDGKAYAWPLWVVPMGMYLNKDVLPRRTSLPPKDWTWDQFVETAKKLTFKRANGEQVYGFSGFVDPGVVNTWGLWMNQDPSVRPITQDGKYGFNSPEAYAALQRYADLALVHKVTPPDFGSLKDSDVKGGFQNKQYAMVVDATGFSPQLKGANINFDIYPLPTFNGNKLTVGAVGLIASPRSATTPSGKRRWTWAAISPAPKCRKTCRPAATCQPVSISRPARANRSKWWIRSINSYPCSRTCGLHRSCPIGRNLRACSILSSKTSSLAKKRLRKG
jgi:multiple sugar transport system substrate-binding protein